MKASSDVTSEEKRFIVSFKDSNPKKTFDFEKEQRKQEAAGEAAVLKKFAKMRVENDISSEAQYSSEVKTMSCAQGFSPQEENLISGDISDDSDC